MEIPETKKKKEMPKPKGKTRKGKRKLPQIQREEGKREKF